MAVELQIEARTLSDITTRALQNQLNTTCFPAFGEAPIAIALMEDGAALVMDLVDRRRPRVAGTFNGPIGAVRTAGNWALASAGRVTSIYRVRRSPDECSCVSHE